MNGTHKTQGHSNGFLSGGFPGGPPDVERSAVFQEIEPESTLNDYESLLARRAQLVQEAAKVDTLIASARQNLTAALNGRPAPLLTDGAQRSFPALPMSSTLNTPTRRGPGRPKGSRTKVGAHSAPAKTDRMSAAREGKARKRVAQAAMEGLNARTRESMDGLLKAFNRLGGQARLTDVAHKLKITVEAARQRIIRGLKLNLVERMPDGSYRLI